MKTHHATVLLYCISVVLAGCSQGGGSSGGGHGTAGSSRPAATENHEWVVVISSGVPEYVRDGLKAELQTLISQVAKKDDVVHVVSAPDHRPVASLLIPEGDLHTRLRHPESKRGLQRIGEFLNAEVEEPNHQLQIPRMSATVLSLRRTQFPLRIILVGDPIYEDERQPGWSMVDGFVPNDASLESPICPFGSGVATFPENSEITWLTPSSTWGTDNLHQSAVTRFYQLFFRLSGGYLARITPDARSAFDLTGTRLNDDIAMEEAGEARMRLVTLESTLPEIEPVVNTIGYELTAQRIVGSSDRQPASEVEAKSEMSEGQEQNVDAASETESTEIPDDVNELLDAAELSRDTITFAMNWVSDDPECDLDMRIRDSRSPKELNYQNALTPFGKLLRDIQHSGSLADGKDLSKWEVAEINHDRLKDLTLWVNVYKTSESAQGRLIVIWNAERHELPFEFDTHQGDGGYGSRSQANCWKQLDLSIVITASNACCDP